MDGVRGDVRLGPPVIWGRHHIMLFNRTPASLGERRGLTAFTVLSLLAGLGFVAAPSVAETTSPAQPYIVTFDDQSTAAEQQSALADAGATDVEGVAPLDLYSASLD